MIKISELDGKAIDKIFYDKVGEIMDRGFPRDVAVRIATEHIFKLWEKEKESESNRKIYRTDEPLRVRRNGNKAGKTSVPAPVCESKLKG